MPRKSPKAETKTKVSVKTKAKAGSRDSTKPRCGLCGKTTKLTKTECCGNWICNDEDKYVMFSYAQNSCHRNHRRYTLCSYHHTEGHEGDWKECQKCREAFQTEMYVWYGTNEFNYEKLPNPPAYEPTRCVDCNRIIKLGTDGYMYGREGYRCERCAQKEMRRSPEESEE